MPEEDKLTFVSDDDSSNVPAMKPWQVLIVDDEADIHEVTKLVLGSTEIEGRSLAFTSAYSAQEAKAILSKQPFALILLDVIMEHEKAGLEVVEYIRKELNDHLMRIIIRTGQAGETHERHVIDNFDINAYKEKTDLNAVKLYTTVRTSLLQYQQIEKLYRYQHALEETIKEKVEEITAQQEALFTSFQQAQTGEILKMLAHQWRQPLGSIASVIGQMKLAYIMDEYDCNEMEKMIDTVEGYVQGLSKTISDFQDLYAPSEMRPKIPVMKLIDEVITFMQEIVEGRCVTLKFENLGVDPQTVCSRELKQVIVNLIQNSVDKICDRKIEQGVVTVTAQEHETLTIQVKDNAGGIDPEVLPRVFDPYFSTKEKRHGVGLGLYVSKEIIKNHLEGSLHAENCDDGACFVIQLPKEKGLG